MYSTKQFYHATSFQNAVKIVAEGFKKGTTGMLGAGIYFAETPTGALNKAHSPILDALVIVVLNAGRLTTETSPHRDWNLERINKIGFDSVEIRNCRTGPEICIYEPERVNIKYVVHWTDTEIKFYEITSLNVNLTDLRFLIEGRKIQFENYNYPDFRNFQKNFEFSGNNSMFNGILNYIRGKNVNLVDINVSSFCLKDKNNWPQNIIKYEDTKSFFCSDDQPNQYIMFDFKNHPVVPKSYSIRSSYQRKDLSHLKSWVIEGSNNEIKWIKLDEQKNNSSLNGSNYSHNFSINNPNNQSYRYLKLVQTDLNWRNRNYLKLNCIEFFGDIL